MKAEQFLFTAAVILALCTMGYFLLPVYAEYRDARREQEKLEEKLMYLEYEYHRAQEDIHALKNNPRAIERVAREKFGWCRADEKIYHFDPPPVYLAEDENAPEPRGSSLDYSP